MPLCKAEGCNEKHFAKGWCRKHYQKWYRRGDSDEKIEAVKERFEEKYIPVTESGCWIWTAYLNEYKYGTFYVNRNGMLAHRFSWELHRGSIPKGMCVLHKCDVRCCVNPDHLFLGTRADNMADMVKKGRASKKPKCVGEKHGMAKLTNKDVLEIRAADETLIAIANKYNVSKSTISNIKLRTNWSHL